MGCKQVFHSKRSRSLSPSNPQEHEPWLSVCLLEAEGWSQVIECWVNRLRWIWHGGGHAVRQADKKKALCTDLLCVCPRQKWDMELIEAKKEQGGGRGIFSGLGRNFPAVASSFLHVFLQRGVRIFVWPAVSRFTYSSPSFACSSESSIHLHLKRYVYVCFQDELSDYCKVHIFLGFLCVHFSILQYSSIDPIWTNTLFVGKCILYLAYYNMHLLSKCFSLSNTITFSHTFLRFFANFLVGSNVPAQTNWWLIRFRIPRLSVCPSVFVCVLCHWRPATHMANQYPRTNQGKGESVASSSPLSHSFVSPRKITPKAPRQSLLLSPFLSFFPAGPTAWLSEEETASTAIVWWTNCDNWLSSVLPPFIPIYTLTHLGSPF